MNVNDQIRSTVKAAMRKRGINQARLAEQLKVTPQALSRTLNERGKIPGLWRAILGTLDLELVAREKED